MNQVGRGDEPIIAALGEGVREPLATLRKIFHDYDVGDATDCPHCAQRTDGQPR